MKIRNNFTTLGHYGGVSVSYLSKMRKFKGKIKEFTYSVILKILG